MKPFTQHQSALHCVYHQSHTYRYVGRVLKSEIIFLAVASTTYLLLEHLLLFLQAYEVIVLNRDDHGVDPYRDHCPVLLLIVYCHLREERREG